MQQHTAATSPVTENTQPQPPFRFRFRLRVRFAETDAQGVVFNGNYWTYTDTAIVEYLRAIGHEYKAMVKQGVDFTVAESKCRFSAGAVFDEWLGVDVRTLHLGRTSWVAEFRISSEDDGRLIALSQNAYVFIAPGGASKLPVPPEFREAVLAYEGSLSPAAEPTPLLDSLTPKE